MALVSLGRPLETIRFLDAYQKGFAGELAKGKGVAPKL